MLNAIKGIHSPNGERVGLAVAPARSYSPSRAWSEAKPPLLASETSPLKTRPSAVTVTWLADPPPMPSRGTTLTWRHPWVPS
jgi:hypothetical protein